MADDALAEVADELYALVPDEFTAARNLRAKQVRLDDRALAKAVSELRRPSPAAWLVNQLVRHRPEDLEGLLDLGVQLQVAQTQLDAGSLTVLARERRAVVRALAREAGQLADDLGNAVRSPVLDEVAETLQAGMTDVSAAAAVRSGRLVRALEAVGTDVDLEGAVAGGLGARSVGSRSASQRGGSAPPDELGARRAKKRQEEDESERERELRERAEHEQAERERAARERAERRADEAEDRAVTAEQAAAEASERLDEAHEGADRVAATRDDLEAQLRDLEVRLAAAERDLADAERAVRPLEREYHRAARAAEEARSAADELRAELD